MAETTTCPKCGNVHNSFADSGKLIPRCPSCFYSYFGSPVIKKTSPTPQASELSRSISPKLMKKSLYTALLFIPLMLGVYSYFSPTLDMNNFRRAITIGTASEISEYVDYEKLRFNVKSRLKAETAEKTLALNRNAFAALAQSMADTVIDRMIDNMISPYGLKGMTKNWNKSNAEKNHYLDFSYQDLNHARIIIDANNWIEMERSGPFSWKIVDLVFPHT